MPLRLAFTVLLCLLLPIVVACGGDDDDDIATTRTPVYQASGLSEIYGRMSEALRRDGEAYRGTVTSVLLQEPFTVVTTLEITAAFGDLSPIPSPKGEGISDSADAGGSRDVRAGADRARVEVHSEFGDIVREATWIIDGERWYQTTPEGGVRKREALRCRGSDDAVLSLLLGCRGAEEESITTPVGEVEYEGRRAIAIVTVGNARGVEEESSFTETLYVDAETWLPLGLEGSGRLVESGQTPVDGTPAAGVVAGEQVSTVAGKIVRYAHAFIPAEEVEASLFDPASIGYADVDPAWALLREEPDFTYYWLGREIVGRDDARPALVLSGAYVADSAVRPVLRYRALLQYREAADEFGQTLVEVVEWRAEEKREVEGERWDRAPEGCVVVDEYEVSLGRVTVYGPGVRAGGWRLEAGGEGTAEGDADATTGEGCVGWGAVVVGATVVLEIRGRGESGWGSAEGMGVLVGAVAVVGE